MGQSSFIQAKLNYKDQETFIQATNLLRNGGWLLEDNTMVLEDGVPADDLWDQDETLNIIDGLTLTIPPGLYYNLSRVTSELTDLALTGEFSEETDDNENYIYVWDDGRSLEASEEQISKYCTKQEDKDLFLMDDSEYSVKYNIDENEVLCLRADELVEARIEMVSVVNRA